MSVANYKNMGSKPNSLFQVFSYWARAYKAAREKRRGDRLRRGGALSPLSNFLKARIGFKIEFQTFYLKKKKPSAKMAVNSKNVSKFHKSGQVSKVKQEA